jgi:hypothetical protein
MNEFSDAVLDKVRRLYYKDSARLMQQLTVNK